MANNAVQVNTFRSLLAEPYVEEQEKREVIKLGIERIDSALNAKGIEKGRVINLEIFDRVYNDTAACLAISLAGVDKKIGLQIPSENTAEFVKSWRKMLQKNPPEKTQYSQDFIQVAPKHLRVDEVFETAEASGVELLIVFEPWKNLKGKRLPAEIADCAQKSGIATILLNSTEYPTWNTQKRMGAPCLQTLTGYNQCNIMVAPYYVPRGKRAAFMNDSTLKKTREMISSKMRVEFVFSLNQPSKRDDFNQKLIRVAFSKHQPLGFDFASC